MGMGSGPESSSSVLQPPQSHVHRPLMYALRGARGRVLSRGAMRRWCHAVVVPCEVVPCGGAMWWRHVTSLEPSLEPTSLEPPPHQFDAAIVVTAPAISRSKSFIRSMLVPGPPAEPRISLALVPEP